MKIQVWLDSGANIHSCYKRDIDIEEEFGLSDKEWEALSEEEQYDLVKDIAWERADWGFRYI